MVANVFIDHLSKFAELSSLLKNGLSQRLKTEQYKRKQILFACGQSEDRLFFVEKGLLRSYYYDEDGKEHTVRFYNENDILFSYQGYWEQLSDLYTEIIEEAVLISLRYEDLRKIIHQFPDSELLIKSIISHYHQEEKTRTRLISLTAEERYKYYKKNNRSIFQKVPLKIIASYLNMSRETLSRLISRQ